MMFLTSSIMVMLLAMILTVSIFFLSFSTENSEIMKGSPFECGFSPLTSSTVSFSVPFFMVSIMFLIFDVEILILCFFPMSGTMNLSGCLLFWIIMLTILLATIYEWKKGVLEWN